MKKSDELKSPKSCLSKAASDEPLFVLRAKDPLAAQVVRLWAAMALDVHEEDKIAEAERIAKDMDVWRNPQPVCKNG